MLLQEGDLMIRDLRAADEGALLRWLTDPAVLEFYEGRDKAFTPELVREHFYDDSDQNMHRCIIEQNGNPIGYLQYYLLWNEEDFDAYDVETESVSVERPVFAMDQFIGEPRLWGQGLGRRFVGMMQRHLAGKENAFAILLDPRADNERAIRCYEACGFRKVKLLPEHELHEGVEADCWLMRWEA